MADLQGFIFLDPREQTWQTAEEYLSGNVRAKLAQAIAAGERTNIRALEEVQPEDVPASEIVARIGSPWVPKSDYEDFAPHLFGDETAFRKQFINSGTGLDELRERLASFAKRTLRRDVLEYIKYTERKALTQPFNPTDDEQALYERISAFLQKEDSYALPKQQRHLTALILRKLLASSSHAVAATLVTIRERLQGLLTAGKTQDDGSQLVEQLIAEDELEQDYLEEEASEADEDAEALTPELAESSKTDAAKDSQTVRAAITAEIAELTAFVDAAQALQTDTKAQALLKALGLGFSKMAELRAPRKAIIFTESRRTQDYLLELLAATRWGEGIVLFNGSNSDARAQAIYKDWLKRHEGTDHITGSKTADTRAALVEHFKERGKVMIATEAGAEGINLQFCSLVINYDLPWNPQRIERRIGRCHRYGQKFDVGVVNFVDRSNEADARVSELLAQKFQLRPDPQDQLQVVGLALARRLQRLGLRAPGLRRRRRGLVCHHHSRLERCGASGDHHS